MEKTKEKIKKDKQSESLLKAANDILKERELIVFNDNKNDIDFVILAMVKILGHTFEQSIQLATIAHHKGSCSAKKGTFEELAHYHHSFVLNKITTEIH